MSEGDFLAEREEAESYAEAKADAERLQELRNEAAKDLASDFDPASKITAIKGQAYLEVKHRLQWFRDKYPQGTIETEITHLFGMDGDNPFVIVRAKVETGEGGSATGFKTEERKHFEDHVEKAETGAIGRALAALGFGTQFAVELDEGTVADAPVKTQRSYPPSQQQARPMGGSGGGRSGQPSQKQWDTFNGLVTKLQVNAIALCKDVAGVDHPNDLTGGREGSMSKVLDTLFGLDRGNVEMRMMWRLDDTPDGPPARHQQQRQAAPPSLGLGNPKANFESQIKKARSSMQLDAIFKGMTQAGLDQDPDLLSLMSDVEAQIESAANVGLGG